MSGRYIEISTPSSNCASSSRTVSGQPVVDRDGDKALVYWLAEECDHWAVAELEREGEASVSWRLFEVEGVEIGPQAPGLKEQARQLLTLADCWGHGWFKWDGCAAVNLQDLHTCCRIQWEASLDQIKELRGISQGLWDIPTKAED